MARKKVSCFEWGDTMSDLLVLQPRNGNSSNNGNYAGRIIDVHLLP